MKRILIIDDDIHINNMLEEVLQKEGYQVAHCLFRNGGITIFTK